MLNFNKPTSPNPDDEDMEEIEKELHMNGRAMRVDETPEEYQKEREESWENRNAEQPQEQEPTPELKEQLDNTIQEIANLSELLVYDKSGKLIFQGNQEQFGAFCHNKDYGTPENIGNIAGPDGITVARFGASDRHGFLDSSRAAQMIQDALAVMSETRTGEKLSQAREALGLTEDTTPESAKDKTPEQAAPFDLDTIAADFADRIEIDEKNPKTPERLFPPAAGNMFGDNDTPTLAGRAVANIYDQLIKRPNHKSKYQPTEILQMGREAVADFESYIEELNQQAKKSGKQEFSFNVARGAGETGFHLNGEETVSRDHLLYFSKSTTQWKNPKEQTVRAYLTLDPKEIKNIQRHFVDLCSTLHEQGIDFTAKASGPNGMDKRTDNTVLYISQSDQEKAGQIIKDFLRAKGIGQGYVDAAVHSPDQEGLSWAMNPTPEQQKIWQEVSGSSQNTSYNCYVATQAIPRYLRRLAEAQKKVGNNEATEKFLQEAARVENIFNK